MAGASFYNRRLLGYIDVSNFAEFQGIGSDPLFKRFNSVESVLNNHIEQEYHSFLSCPFYEDGNIYWYVDEWNDLPKSYLELNGDEKIRYANIKEKTIQYYQTILSKVKDEDYVILNGALKFISDEFIYCYDNKVVLIAWGMKPDNEKHVVNGKWFKKISNIDKKKITFDIGENGRLDNSIEGVAYLSTYNREIGYKMTSRDIPIIIANDGFKFFGWDPNPIGYEVIDDFTFKAQYTKIETPLNVTQLDNTVRVIFDAGNKGIINEPKIIEIPKGHVLKDNEIPTVFPNQGFQFNKWSPYIYQPINCDTFFIAEYTQDFAKCTFNADQHGILIGETEILKPLGFAPLSSEIPKVKPLKRYKFIGWDIDPMTILTEDRLCTAQYEQIIPWYKKFWLWLNQFFARKGCLKWLLWILLFVLLLWLLSWLLRGCFNKGNVDRAGNVLLPDDKVDKIEQITNPDGVVRDNNGTICDIIGDNGKLPDNGVTSPVVGEDGVYPPIISNPGVPDVIDNRLNIYFEDEKADLNKWAKDFKQIYQSENYQIIGYDPNVKMIQILVPSGQRNVIREELPKKITDQEFFIIDESIMTLHGRESESNINVKEGWHLKSTHVKEGWAITKGDPKIVIAIIDDGIDVNHKMFTGRFFKAYNIFTQNRALSSGQGHGTHVAGIAAGSAEFYNQGAAGVAPNCKIMPVQVFDNGMCTFSSLTSGIMYAIHNGANIVNVSVGPSFAGLDQLPVDKQIQVANQYFKNEERVYKHIINIAKKKNVILVFAAGNDNIVTAILPECRDENNTVNVAACTPEYKSSEFTNILLGTNVSAPGVNIYSSYSSNSFKMLDGTSMAAPIISGTIALMKTINKDITARQAIAVIQSNGRNIDKFIPPMVLIDKSLQSVKEGRMPSELVWNKRIKQENIKNFDENPIDSKFTEIPKNMEHKSDDYSSLQNLLTELKKQRKELDKKIDEIEKKLK